MPRKPTAAREQRLKAAYANVFNGSQDALLVLTDLATFTGFYGTVPDETPNDVLRIREGRRQAYWYIWRNLRMTPAEQMALEIAVRSEVLGEDQE